MPHHILVVDDEPAVRRVLARTLQAAGYVCRSAGSAAEALEVMRRGPVDLVLSDIGMPGGDGLSLARSIQRDYPRTSVIMVTGNADFAAVTDARHAGVLDYLVKPISSTDLLASVARVIGVRERMGIAPSRAPDGVATATATDDDAAGATPSAIDRLLRDMAAAGASDLHLSVGMPPLVRRDGDIMPLYDGAAPLHAETIVELLLPIVPGKNRNEFHRRHDSDFAYEIEGVSRFRANIFRDRRGMGAVFRTIPSAVVSAEELGLPSTILELCQLKKGLVLVTGPTGSGKSTTLAAMVDYINRTRSEHVITIEDPIEFIHESDRCLINQREVFNHTRSFKSALRAALRQDPDVVLIGEMRDLETVSIALKTAETGHLVLGTLHTTTAASTIDRIVDQFPASRQAQVRVMLSESLKGVIAQTLCRRIGGGRVAAMEILVVNSAISNLIREGKTFQVAPMMQVGRSAGMVTLNHALLDLVRGGVITTEEAMLRAVDKDAMAKQLAAG